MDWKYLLKLIVLLVFVPFTSLRTVYKHAPLPGELSGIFILLWFSVAYIFLHPKSQTKLNKYLENPLILVLIVGMSVVARFYLYPIVDGIGMGATGDDAFFLPINRLLNFEAPYNIQLHDGAPISPGFGWLLINAPFGISYFLPFFVPIYLLITIYLIKEISHSWMLGNCVCLLVTSTTIFWTLLSSGHDLPAVSLSLVISYVLVELNLKASRGRFIIAIVVGCFSTSRIVFMLLPFLFLFMHVKYRPNYALKLFLLSLCTACLLHAMGFALSDGYQPMHLVTRGIDRVGLDVIMCGGIMLCIAMWFLFRNISDNPSSRLTAYASVLAFILITIAVGEFRSDGYNFAAWEGLSYLYVASPIVVFAVLNSHIAPRRIQS